MFCRMQTNVFNDVISWNFIDSVYLTLFCVLIIGILTFCRGNSQISNNKMETRRSDAYFRVFTFFLTQPKKGPARKRSFEYMEIGAGGRECLEGGEEKDGAQQEEQDGAILRVDDGYLDCIDSSQVADCFEDFPHKALMESRDDDVESRDDVYECASGMPNEESLDDVTSGSEKETIDSAHLDDDLTVCEPDSFPSSDSDGSISPPEFDSYSGATWYSNFDSPQFRPTLSCIEEGDESWPLYSESQVDQSPSRFRDLNWSMEALTSQSFKGSLSRVDTFDDLSALQCPDEHVDDEENDDSDQEVSVLLRQGGTSPDMTSPTRLLSDSDSSRSPSNEGMKVYLQAPVRPDSPPVLVVESLEDYMRSVQRQRLKTHSNQSSVTNSPFSSRDSLDRLHHSTPDITESSYIDDVDLQYLPVSYAGTRVKRKNWVKRSVSNVNDRYYFSGDPHARKGTLRQRVVRKLSKRYKSRESLDGVVDETSKPEEKLVRRSSIRAAVGRFVRRFRHRSKKKDSVMRESTWSLPTNLDNSYSSGDYFVTESEVLPDV